MRTILVVLFVFFFLLFELPFMGIMWMVGKFNKPKSDLVQLRVVQWAFRCVMFIAGTKLTVKGMENVPKDESVLYISNHRGFFDVVTTYSLCPGLTGYISKDSVGKVPVLGLVMKRLYCLFMNREDVKQSMKVILQAIDCVKRGISICIFPEGTRNEDREHPEKILPFKNGSFKIAQKSGCKIIPIAITGTDDVLENHFPWVKSCAVTVTYGKPIVLSELDKEIQKHPAPYVQQVIADILKESLKHE